jgi:hypothetical protein
MAKIGVSLVPPSVMVIYEYFSRGIIAEGVVAFVYSANVVGNSWYPRPKLVTSRQLIMVSGYEDATTDVTAPVPVVLDTTAQNTVYGAVTSILSLSAAAAASPTPVPDRVSEASSSFAAVVKSGAAPAATGSFDP